MFNGRNFTLCCQKKRILGDLRLTTRAVIDGILWIHRTGAPWNDLPARYGSRGTVSSRFYRWRSQGIWQEILNRLQQTADAANQIDWEVHFIDSTIVRAHQHAAGAKRGN